MKRIYPFILILSICFSFAKEPVWVTNPKKDDKYFYFVGYSEDIDSIENVKEKALYNAKSKIASSIFEETEVEKIFSTYGNLSSDKDLQRNYTEEIKSKSIVQLSGVEVDEVSYEETEDSGLKYYKVWVLTKISKATFESERNRILSELKRKLELVDKQLELAENELKEGNILKSIEAYYTAALSSVKVKERRDEFPVYISKITKILQNVEIAPAEEAKEIDISKGGKFGFKISYSDGKRKIPLSGAKVNFTIRNNSGNYAKLSTSSEDGTVSCGIQSLNEVNDETILYAKLVMDFPELTDIEKDYKKFYLTLMDAVEKISTSITFSTTSSKNRQLATAVVALIENNGSYILNRELSSEAQSILVAKGYKVKNTPSGINYNLLADIKKSELNKLEENGIKQVLIIIATGEESKYDETLERYIANYTVTLQLVEVSSGEIINSKNAKIIATSPSKKGILNSFLSAVSKELKRLIK
ncbi:MAG: hypothetical protein ACP5QT_08390 [Brevinematia bacterium]